MADEDELLMDLRDVQLFPDNIDGRDVLVICDDLTKVILDPGALDRGVPGGGGPNLVIEACEQLGHQALSLAAKLRERRGW